MVLQSQGSLELLRAMGRPANPTQALINESTAEMSTSNDGQHTLVVQARKTEATNGLSMIRNRPSTSRSSKSVRRSNWRRMWGYVQILEEVEYIRRGSEHEEQITKHQWSTTFTLPYLQCFLGWQLLRSYGQVSRSLRYCPRLVNPRFFKSSILNDGSGAVKTLQDAFTRRELSPFAVDEKGRTLLHYAAQYFNPAVCSMLVGLRVNPEQTDVYGKSSFAGLCPFGLGFADDWRADSQYLDTVRSLVDPPNCQFEFSAMDVKTFYEWYMGPPEVAEFILSHSMSLSEMSNYQDFAMTPLHLALDGWRQFSGYETCNYAERWLYIVRKLLRGTVDVHAQCRGCNRIRGRFERRGSSLMTPLECVLLKSYHPFDGEDAAKTWLALLHETGYDIVAYLTQEMFLHARDEFTLFDPWHQIPAGTRCFHSLSSYPVNIILVHLDPPRVWWDWYIEPECKASHVLHEFRNFGIHHGAFPWSWSDSWPFYYPNWANESRPWWPPIAAEAWEQRTKPARTRHARRAEQTSRKLTRSQRRRAPPVPGAWIE